MCSNIDAEDYIQTPVELKSDKISKCRKCDNLPFVRLQKKDVLCRRCHYDLCVHKFRASIGKSRLIKLHSKILVAYSGGPASRAMIDLIIDSIENQPTHKRLRIEPCFLYIDEFQIDEDQEELKTNFRIIKDTMLSTKRRCILSSLEMIYSDRPDKYCELRNNTEYYPMRCQKGRDRIGCVLSSFGSLTSKEEWVYNAKLQLIHDIALTEGVDFIFLGSSISRLAVSLITNLAQGKGSQISDSNAFCDRRFEVSIIRPMRELTRKEITFFNILRGNKIVEKKDFGTKAGDKSSIGKMAESFILGLEDDFPSTVFTIFNTGSKISTNPVSGKRCKLCNLYLDKPIGRCTAYGALELSRGTSGDVDVERNDKFVDYCYGCTIMLRDFNDKPENLIYKHQIEKSFRA